MLILSGFVGTLSLIFGRLLKDREWPYYRLLAAGLFTTGVLIGIYFRAFNVELPDRRAMRYLVARGLFGAASFILMTLSVRMGTPAGDVSALGTINTVVAAVLGRLLLNEELRWIQVFASVMCILGAVLISKPKFVFGGIGSGADAWYGYSLALAGGCGHAGIALCSRMVKHLSPWWPTCAATFLIGTSSIVLPAIGVINDFDMLPIFLFPFKSSAWFLVLFLCGTCTMASNSAAGQWCAPAVSATIGTASRIFWGYLGEVVFFGTIPDLLTIVGVLLMFASVVAMVFAKSSVGQCDASPDEDIASFVASSCKSS